MWIPQHKKLIHNLNSIPIVELIPVHPPPKISKINHSPHNKRDDDKIVFLHAWQWPGDIKTDLLRKDSPARPYPSPTLPPPSSRDWWSHRLQHHQPQQWHQWQSILFRRPLHVFNSEGDNYTFVTSSTSMSPATTVAGKFVVDVLALT